jgi:hypothetical protein
LRTRTDAGGRWVLSNIPAGRVTITADSQGFRREVRQLDYDPARPMRYNFRMEVGAVNSTVEVNSSMAVKESQQIEKQARQNAALADTAASVNVTALQSRVVGVLPIAINVPRAGNAYRFVRPLVVDEETRVTFSYRAGAR